VIAGILAQELALRKFARLHLALTLFRRPKQHVPIEPVCCQGGSPQLPQVPHGSSAAAQCTRAPGTDPALHTTPTPALLQVPAQVRAAPQLLAAALSGGWECPYVAPLAMSRHPRQQRQARVCISQSGCRPAVGAGAVRGALSWSVCREGANLRRRDRHQPKQDAQARPGPLACSGLLLA